MLLGIIQSTFKNTAKEPNTSYATMDLDTSTQHLLFEPKESNVASLCSAATMRPIVATAPTFVDSCASYTVTGSTSHLIEVTPVQSTIYDASGRPLEITAEGTDTRLPLLANRVKVIPGIPWTLISWGLLEQAGYTYVRDATLASTRHWLDSQGRIVLTATLNENNHIYAVSFDHPVVARASKLWSSINPGPEEKQIQLLHLGLGHISEAQLDHVIKKSLIDNLPGLSGKSIHKYFPTTCTACLKGGGQHILPANVTTSTRYDIQDSTPELISPLVPVSTPVPSNTAPLMASALRSHPSPRGDTLCLDFSKVEETKTIEDQTDAEREALFLGGNVLVARTQDMRYMHIKILPTQTELQFTSAVRTILEDYRLNGHKLRAIKADNQFDADRMRALCIEYGLPGSVELCAPYEHRQNGTAERAIQTLDKLARKELHTAHVSFPREQWALAYHHATSMLNMTTETNFNESMSAFECFTGIKPDYDRYPFLPFGTLVHSLIEPASSLAKLDSRTFEGYFIGPSVAHLQSVRIFDKLKKTIKVQRSYWPISTPLDICTNGADLTTKSFTEHSAAEMESFVEQGSRRAIHHATVLEKRIRPKLTPLEASHLQQVNSNLLRRTLLIWFNIRPAIQRRRAEELDACLLARIKNNPLDANLRLRLSKMITQKHSRITQKILDREKLAVSRTKQVDVTTSDIYKRAYTPRQSSSHNAPILAALTNLAQDLTLAQEDAEAITEFIPDPRGVKQMLKHPEAAQWQLAENKEINMLNGRSCWQVQRLHDIPFGTKIYNSNFIYKTKINPDGDKTQFKARLVLCGNEQEKGDNYSPTIHAELVRLFLALAAINDCEISTLDVTGAFICEFLPDDIPIYMRLPKHICTGEADRIVKLIRSLYGLREAPLIFFTGLSTYLISMGFKQSSYDDCLFIRELADGYQYVLIHVDDMLLISPTKRALNDFREAMLLKYETTVDLEAEYFLGIKITRNRTARSLTIAQPGFAKRIQLSLNIAENAPPVSAPGRIRYTEDKMPVDLTLVPFMRKIVGMLQFICNTRVDIVCEVNKLAKRMNQPTATDLEDGMHLATYVVQTAHWGVTFQTSEDKVRLVAWADASFESERDGYSRSGLIFTLGEDSGAFLAKSFTQWMRALSTQESEIQTLSEGARFVMFFRYILEEAGFPQEPTVVFEDNNACISFTRGQGNYDRTKHITRHYHYAKDREKDGSIVVTYVSTKKQRADQCTKILSPTEHREASLINLNIK